MLAPALHVSGTGNSPFALGGSKQRRYGMDFRAFDPARGGIPMGGRDASQERYVNPYIVNSFGSSGVIQNPTQRGLAPATVGGEPYQSDVQPYRMIEQRPSPSSVPAPPRPSVRLERQIFQLGPAAAAYQRYGHDESPQQVHHPPRTLRQHTSSETVPAGVSPPMNQLPMMTQMYLPSRNQVPVAMSPVSPSTTSSMPHMPLSQMTMQMPMSMPPHMPMTIFNPTLTMSPQVANEAMFMSQGGFRDGQSQMMAPPMTLMMAAYPYPMTYVGPPLMSSSIPPTQAYEQVEMPQNKRKRTTSKHGARSSNQPEVNHPSQLLHRPSSSSLQYLPFVSRQEETSGRGHLDQGDYMILQQGNQAFSVPSEVEQATSSSERELMDRSVARPSESSGSVQGEEVIQSRRRGLGGEKRLLINFESLGEIHHPIQILGAERWIIPHGLTGTHTVYGQDWRFRITYESSPKNTVILRFEIQNLSSNGRPVWLVETPEQASTRQSRGKTVCNRAMQLAFEERRRELADVLDEATPTRAANIRALMEKLADRHCTEGVLFFGLRHSVVQDTHQEARNTLLASLKTPASH